MAEALGLVASLIAIGQGVAVVPVIIDTLVSLPHTSDELADLLNELETIRICGAHVEHVVQSIATAPGSDIQEPPPLRATRSRLEAVLDQLTRLADSCSGAKTRTGKARAASLKWVLKKNKIAVLRNKTREARQDIQYAITTMIWEHHHAQGRINLDVHAIVTESAHSISTIKEDLHQYYQRASESSRLTREQNLPVLEASNVDAAQAVTSVGETVTPTEHIASGHVNPPSSAGEIPTTDSITTNVGIATQDKHPRTSDIIDLSGSGLQPEKAGVVRINATVHVKCVTGCRCQCHVARRTASSPSWLRPVLGSVLLVYQNLPILGFRPCNEPQCLNASSMRLNYRFPTWLWNRALVLTTTLADLSGIGASLHLRVPRVIYPGDNLWALIIKNELSQIQKAFSQRLYSPTDVGQSGNSILHWSLVRRELGTVAFLVEHFLDMYRSHDMQREIFEAKNWHQRSEHRSKADKEVLKKIAFIHDDDGDHDAFGHLNEIQSSALGLGDMAAALKRSTEGLNERDEGGHAPLHHVCQRSNVDGLRLLLNAGAHVDVRNDFGSTPLMIASQTSVHCVKLLVELGGCNVDARDCPGRTALHYAADAPTPGAHETIKYLLSMKATYGPTNLGRTPLLFLGPDEGDVGAELMEEEVSRRFEALLQFGASLGEVDGSGRRAVDWAIHERRATVLRVLIRAGAQLNGHSLDGRSLLHYAAMYGNQKTIAVLRDAEPVGLNVQHRDKHGDTPEDCLHLRKSGKPGHWAQVRIQSQEEEDAIRALFQEIRKRNKASDLSVCKSVKEALQHHNSRGALRLLAPLIEQKMVWKKDIDAETLDAIAIQIREAMFDAAMESLDEVVELWGKGEELGPLVVGYDFEDDPVSLG